LCIPTYCRPQGLRRLLAGLERQIFVKCNCQDVEIVVIDNDSAGSAKEICASVGSSYRWQVTYLIESRRDISFVRNRAIDVVKEAGAELMAFIDDDEVPTENWLDEFLFIQEMYDADMAFGPVVPYFDEPVPDWFIEGKFFDNPRYASGYPAYGGTDNVLFRTRFFAATICDLTRDMRCLAVKTHIYFCGPG
jgi:succinoglycan biosynthesis protein ExoM